MEGLQLSKLNYCEAQTEIASVHSRFADDRVSSSPLRHSGHYNLHPTSPEVTLYSCGNIEKMKKFLLILASAVLLSGCTIQGLFQKKPAGLEIVTVPAATVFLNGENV